MSTQKINPFNKTYTRRNSSNADNKNLPEIPKPSPPLTNSHTKTKTQPQVPNANAILNSSKSTQIQSQPKTPQNQQQIKPTVQSIQPTTQPQTRSSDKKNIISIQPTFQKNSNTKAQITKVVPQQANPNQQQALPMTKPQNIQVTMGQPSQQNQSTQKPQPTQPIIKPQPAQPNIKPQFPVKPPQGNQTQSIQQQVKITPQAQKQAVPAIKPSIQYKSAQPMTPQTQVTQKQQVDTSSPPDALKSPKIAIQKPVQSTKIGQPAVNQQQVQKPQTNTTPQSQLPSQTPTNKYNFRQNTQGQQGIGSSILQKSQNQVNQQSKPNMSMAQQYTIKTKGQIDLETKQKIQATDLVTHQGLQNLVDKIVVGEKRKRSDAPPIQYILESDVSHQLSDITKDMLSKSIDYGCRMAQLRNSKTLEAKDFYLYLKNVWDIVVPGYQGIVGNLQKRSKQGNDGFQQEMIEVRRLQQQEQ